MALMRWEPFREIDTLQREMNRLFDSLTPAPRNGLEVNFIPAAEISETQETLQLSLEIPGMEPKDLEVEVTADSVTVRGERQSETRTEEQGVTRSEFRYGKFHRVIPLPARIQNTEAKAEYKNGILRLTLPKVEEEKNKVVKVEIG